MKTIEVLIKNKNGIHARPASLLVKLTNKFKSDIFMSFENEKINAKSIMGIMLLAVEQGKIIKVSAEGTDENDALLAIKELIEIQQFGEV